jgi:hypothetical protein
MITLTNEDRALLDACDSTPDLPPTIGLRSAILQAGSPELLPGDSRHMPGAAAGDIVLRHGADSTLVKGSVGFSAVPVAFKTSFVEWEPNRSGGSPVDDHLKKPADAIWRDGPDGRRACLRDNGNKIEETVVAHLLVNGCGILFPFRSTAVRAGIDFADRARVRVTIDGRDAWSFANGKWLIAARLERKGDFRWFLPVVTLIGRFGEEGGPPLEEWRLALHARRAFKEGGAWDPASLAALPPPPAPAKQVWLGQQPPMSRRRKAALEDIDVSGPRRSKASKTSRRFRSIRSTAGRSRGRGKRPPLPQPIRISSGN